MSVRDRRLVPAALRVAAFLGLLSAFPAEPRAETGGAAFLKIGVGARPQSMGSAFTAVADDASALQWNPGGLVQLKAREISATHINYLEGVGLGAAGYVHPTARGALGVHAAYLAHRPLEGRAEDGAETGSFRASDATAALSFARRAGDRMGLGIGVKLIRQEIAGESAQGAALDAGALFRTSGSRWRWGLALRNVGPALKFLRETYELPAAATAGVSVEFSQALTAAADVGKSFAGDELRAGAGMEFRPFPAAALRAGYALSAVRGSGRGSGGLPGILRGGADAGLTGGLGLRAGRYRFDYAFTPLGELGSVQRATVGATF